ncbi:hypothetical protein ACTL31_07860 [Leuconostoc mesenteroides]
MAEGINKKGMALIIVYFTVIGTIVTHFFPNMSYLGYMIYAILSILSGTILYNKIIGSN